MDKTHFRQWRWTGVDQVSIRVRLCAILLLMTMTLFSQVSKAAVSEVDPQILRSAISEFFPSATRSTSESDDLIRLYQLDQEIGFVFQSNDYVNITGFSGDRINLLIGLGSDGTLVGTRLIHHHEPIFLHGLGPKPLLKFLDQYRDHPLNRRVVFGKPGGQEHDPQTEYFDGVTKATVSIIVANDTVLSAAKEVARRNLPDFAQQAPARVRTEVFNTMGWQQLLDTGLIRRWQLRRADFESALGGQLDSYDDPQLRSEPDHFTLFYTYLNTPSTGKNLLGEADFARLQNLLSEGEHAIAVMWEGFYDALEPDFRPGTIPQRLSLSQGGLPITIRDLNFFHMSPPQLPQGAEHLDNIRVYKIRPQAGFNPAAPMSLGLDIKLRRNHLLQDQLSFTDTLQLPSALFEQVAEDKPRSKPLWLSLWEGRLPQIVVLCLGLALLTAGFIWQRRWLYPARRFHILRWSFLLFTLLFIGIYAQGQLSVVNIFTLLLALIQGFDIRVFLLDPVLFILWSYTAATLILWGRGLFCGWLCPFGVMQELVAALANKLGLRQWTIKPRLHYWLTKLKYVVLAVLVGVSLVSLTAAEKLAEIEPFKTSVTLLFIREWPFVIYALVLLALGLFVHKFYCRYLCPLGAGLAILGRLRRFEWLDRRAECGSPCQLCRHRCGINAIDRRGRIDYDECIQCLECVVILQDPEQCAPVKAAKKRGDKELATATLIPISATQIDVFKGTNR